MNSFTIILIISYFVKFLKKLFVTRVKIFLIYIMFNSEILNVGFENFRLANP
jgi:hypothetical protein